MDIYAFPADYVGRKRYVTVRGHSRSVCILYTYKGMDGYNHVLPEYGGDGSGIPFASTHVMPDIAGFVSPVDGSHISSRSHKRDHVRRYDLVEVGDQPLRNSQPSINMPRAGHDIKRALEMARGR